MIKYALYPGFNQGIQKAHWSNLRHPWEEKLCSNYLSYNMCIHIIGNMADFEHGLSRK